VVGCVTSVEDAGAFPRDEAERAGRDARGDAVVVREDLPRDALVAGAVAQIARCRFFRALCATRSDAIAALWGCVVVCSGRSVARVGLVCVCVYATR